MSEDKTCHNANDDQAMGKEVKKDKPGKNKLKRIPVRSAGSPDIPFEDNTAPGTDAVFIECPGATVYRPGTREVIGGAHFLDDNDPSRGYEIVDKPIYAPGHTRRRIIKKEHIRSIRRCQACQDLTVRMMRREGPDMCIPSHKFPYRRRLKPVEKTW
ncbi:MAG: hypothetical protein JSV44_12595 [Candidatus Zixiibacteriota bacterium]|nr:MAG: hypothetical protein JSV44_12595 [candidate division Zixibacteria bacterium]